VGKFRGWHIVAGIAAMLFAGFIGSAIGLNNTATFMASGVAFVAVSLWVDSRMSRRRRAARGPGAGQDTEVPLDADASKRES
jgi:hypothetical protein